MVYFRSNHRTHKSNRYHFSVSAWPVAFTVVVVTLSFINCLYAACLRTVDMNYVANAEIIEKSMLAYINCIFNDFGLPYLT